MPRIKYRKKFIEWNWSMLNTGSDESQRNMVKLDAVIRYFIVLSGHLTLCFWRSEWSSWGVLQNENCLSCYLYYLCILLIRTAPTADCIMKTGKIRKHVYICMRLYLFLILQRASYSSFPLITRQQQIIMSSPRIIENHYHVHVSLFGKVGRKQFNCSLYVIKYGLAYQYSIF